MNQLIKRCALLSLSLLTIAKPVSAQNTEECCEQKAFVAHKHQFYIGPEVYNVNRKRENGSKQNGPVGGFRVGYDRIKRYHWYWGAEALFAGGTLDGHSGNSNKIRSDFSDVQVEGRFGYTFGQKFGWRAYIIPFGGIGYAVERNNFKHPSPIPAYFKIHYPYGSAGFLSQISPLDNWDIGLNFKAIYPFEARCHVTKDPEHDNSKQLTDDKWHYRAELPITYHLFGNCDKCWLRLVPFYEYRQYGKRPNYPFDFLETQLNIWGATLKFMYTLE